MDPPCLNSEIDESVATSSKMDESTNWNKKNSTENCLYCGEFLDPERIGFNVNTFSTYVWCQKCDKRNYVGRIRQNPKPLPTPPVIKQLAGYQLRERKIPDYQLLKDSFSDDTNDENVESTDSSPSSTGNRLSNRLTPEEISRMMCDEARAKRQEKMKNLKE